MNTSPHIEQDANILTLKEKRKTFFFINSCCPLYLVLLLNDLNNGYNNKYHMPCILRAGMYLNAKQLDL